MQILGQKLNQDEFRNYVATYDFGRIKPDSLVIHHTWSPKKKDWKGESTLMGIKNYYEGLGWNAGPHLFIAEDGIWLFTPMNEVGIHAGKGNSHSKFGMLQGYSIGIEVVGDYDVERWTGKTYSNALATIRILMDKLNLTTEQIFFHRDFSSKSCPGHAITKEWLFQELSKRDSNGSKKPADLSNISSWAREGFQWQIENDFDQSVLPHQKVEAEWVFAILKKYHDKYGKN